MRSRALTLVIALVLAVAGTSAVLAYVRQADTRALEGMRAVTVLVAGQQIPAGTAASSLEAQGLVHAQRMPASSVPADALTAITPAQGVLVTNAVIQPGQLLLSPMLATSAPVTGGLQVPQGMVAVSFVVCLTEAVEGFIQPGSVVTVFDLQTPGLKGSLSDGAGCSGSHSQLGTVITTVVLPRVQILAVGQTVPSPVPSGAASAPAAAGGAAGSGSSGSTSLVPVTVALPQAQAEKIMELSLAGVPYLGLLNGSSALPTSAGTAAHP